MALSAGLQDPEVRLLTVTGPGGVGKTRLATATATATRDAFPDGMAFVDLSPLTDAALVLPTIAGTLGVRASVREPLVTTLANFVSTRRLLLLLDNCEPVLGAAPELATLLGGCPGLTILATSREPLRVRGEHEFLLLPLPLPAIDRLPATEELTHSPAVALFVERARAVQPHFALTADNALSRLRHLPAPRRTAPRHRASRGPGESAAAVRAAGKVGAAAARVNGRWT